MTIKDQGLTVLRWIDRAARDIAIVHTVHPKMHDSCLARVEKELLEALVCVKAMRGREQEAAATLEELRGLPIP